MSVKGVGVGKIYLLASRPWGKKSIQNQDKQTPHTVLQKLSPKLTPTLLRGLPLLLYVIACFSVFCHEQTFENGLLLCVYRIYTVCIFVVLKILFIFALKNAFK